MKPAQLTLNLPSIAARGWEDFLVSSSNAQAVEMIDGWRRWPDGRLILCGPARSGKTHLASIWAERCGARMLEAARLAAGGAAEEPCGADPLAVENVDRLATLAPADRETAEKALFHLYNRMGANRRPLLITGTGFPANWSVALPDLRSRLAAATVAGIGPPDDALLSCVMVKLFADRQLLVEPKVIGYMLDRMERSCAAAEALIDRLDAASLSSKRRVTIALAREHGGWRD